MKDEFEETADPPEEEDTTEELILRLENCVALCEKAERYELMLEVNLHYLFISLITLQNYITFPSLQNEQR